MILKDKYVFLFTRKLKKCFWFLCCFQEKEQKYQLRLDGVRLRDAEAGFISRKAAFAIFNPDQK